jgi:rod shape-determining protein MreC
VGSPPLDRDPERRRSGGVFALLVLAALTVMVLDTRAGESPIDPLRSAVGTAIGPLESGTATAVRAARSMPAYIHDVDDLRDANADLEETNSELRTRLRTSEVARQRAGELDRMLGVAEDGGLSIVPARVISLGAVQSFSRTVSIDAGSRDGVRPDMTVVSGDGLVGRVLHTTQDTATVLLILDAESVVGGRLSSSLELGFLSGDGRIGDDARLSLELVDPVTAPAPRDIVVTWGSRSQAPYVSGVPIGTVREVSSSPRELSRIAVVEPFVDFSSLDLVGVVVGAVDRDAREAVEASR